jgi:hypothetical protein
MDNSLNIHEITDRCAAHKQGGPTPQPQNQGKY